MILKIAVILLVPVFLGCGSRGQDVYMVYYLGGQSNMDGYGYVSELPAGLRETADSVYIFHGNTAEDGDPVDGSGIWARLRPGHGYGMRSDTAANYYSDRFGVELTFGRRMRELDPRYPIALIKYSKGGTSLDSAAARSFGCWEPDLHRGNGVSQFDHFQAAVRNGLNVRDINQDGRPDRLIPAGIVWMQGESDGDCTREIADRYEEHLVRIIDLIRQELGDPQLPAAIGWISDSGSGGSPVWEFGDIIRAAQASFTQNDVHSVLVTSTDTYGYSDPWHYDTAGFIDLGRQFAEALYRLRESD